MMPGGCWMPLHGVRRKYVAAALVAATIAAFPAAAGVLSPFEAHYRVERGGFGLGTTMFSLAADGDCYRFRGEALPNALVSLFVGDVFDESGFCSSDGQVAPRWFRHFESDDAGDSYSLDFHDDGRVTYKSRAGRARTFEAPEGALEPFVIQVAVRLWLAGAAEPAAAPNRLFTVVDENEIKRYELAVREGGRIETPAGAWETLIVERVDDPDRKLRFWLAPALDWLPVRVEHRKRDDPAIRMTLQKLPHSPAEE